MNAPRFKTIPGAARLVDLAPADLRDRLDRLDREPSIVVAGLRLARRGADLVEIARASGPAERGE